MTHMTHRYSTLALVVIVAMGLAAVPLTASDPATAAMALPSPPSTPTSPQAASQVRWPLTVQDSILALVDGRLVVVVMGPGVTIDKSTIPYRLTVTVPTPPPPIIPSIRYQTDRWVLTSPAPDTPGPATFTLTQAPDPIHLGDLQVYRNGLIQFPSIDYNYSALPSPQVTFLFGTWDGDYIGVRYRVQP